MSRTLKKVISLLLVVVVLFAAAPLSGFVGLELFGFRASAVEETDTTISGTIGTKLSWSIDKATKALTIDNKGAMISFASDDAPWRNYKDYFDSVVVNEGCTNISQNAFCECNNIVSVELPDTIETIDTNAFYNCQGLISIDIPNSVRKLGNYAFYNCFSLDTMLKLQNVSSIGRSAFNNCDGITSVSFNCKELTVNDYAFIDCSNLVSVNFKCDTLYFDYSVFMNCDALSSVSFECAKLHIGYESFADCDSLKSILVNCNVNDNNGYYSDYNKIQSKAFYGCDNLESAIISVGIDSIGTDAFANCPKLEKVTIYNKNCEIAETAISIYSTIYGFTGSTAETFANTYGYNFVSIDTPCEHTYSNDCDTSCNICGETRETAHDYSEWTVTKEAGCNKTGLRERTCSICGDVDKEIIEMLPHTDEDEDGICEVCKKQFEIKYPMHGVCGDNLTWELNDEGVLTIEGTGAMYDFKESNYIMISDGSGIVATTAVASTTAYDDVTDGFETTTKRPAETTAFDDVATTTKKYETTKNYGDSGQPSVTHPNGEDYYEGTTSYYTTTRKATTTKKVPTTTKRAETTTVRSEESTTVPSTTRPESTTAATTSNSSARVVMYAAQTTTTTYYGDTSTTVAQSFPNKEGYITIIRWNLHFDKIKKVVISEGVTSIGSYAFANCPQLSEIVISDSVTNIGYRAFINCTGLKETEITKNICTVGAYAFQGCSLLETLNFNAQNANSIYYNAFYNCPIKTLNIGPSVNNFPKVSSVETVAIAEGTAVVPYEAFSGCKYLTNVSLPNTLTTISENAFYNCTSLESINIPDSVTYIGRYAFQNCEGLAVITTPNSDCYIDYRAFSNCLNLTTVNYNTYSSNIYYNSFENCPVKTLNVGVGVNHIPKFYTVETVTFADGATIVPSYAFSKCINLKTINLPDTITHIYMEAFRDCDSLVNFEIPENVVYIGDNAFNNCDSLTEITIPESVEEIRSSAFGYCYNLSTVNFNTKNCYVTSNAFYQCPIKTLNVGAGVNNLPNLRTLETATFADGATIVPDYTFSNCTELTSVTLPDSIETIGFRAFDFCSSLESIKLPKNLKTIGERAFYACYNLKTADLPDSVERIERMAFDNCTSLEEIILPDTVEYIGQYAFYGCTSVPSITIPENVQQIGYAAFGSCYELEFVEFNAVDCNLSSDDIFYNCEKISSITFGSGVTRIPNRILMDKTNITSVSIPESVVEIGWSAFNGCSALTSITIPESVEYIGDEAFANLHNLTEINYNAVCSNHVDYPYTYYSCCNCFLNSGISGDGITVNIGNEVEYIPQSIFDTDGETTMPQIAKVNMGESVKEIGAFAFSRCSGINSIDLKNVEIINRGAFYSCSNITEITIPESLTKMHYMAFEGCTGLETINYNAVDCAIINENSTSAFSGCNNVKTAYIGENVKRIPAYAFTGCRELVDVVIPDIIVNIDSLAFFECSKIAINCISGSYAHSYSMQNSLKYKLTDNAKGTVFEIQNGVMLGYNGTAKNVVVPSEVEVIGLNAFSGSNVEHIEIPYSVTKFFAGAFANCPNLKSVIIPFTVTDISSTAFTGTDTTIYCYYNSYAYNYAVANNIKYELITVTLSTNSVNIVETEAVTVNAVPSVTLASGVPLVWKSANPAVASVDSTGKIVGNTVGNTTVGIYALDGNMLDECSVTVGQKSEIKLEDVSTDTLKYGEKIILHVNTSGLPDGATVKWTTSNSSILKMSNENAECSTHENCTTCTVESVGNGSAEIKATVVDKNDNPIVQNGEEISVSYQMNSKAGFFQKIIAFFKKLFGLLKTYPQAFKGIF